MTKERMNSHKPTNHEKPVAKQIFALIHTMLVGIVCGLCFGLVMALVSNGFVMGVQWLTTLRASNLANMFQIGGVSLGPLISLLLAAAALIAIKSMLGIPRWHGPADAIHAAHRSDNE